MVIKMDGNNREGLRLRVVEGEYAVCRLEALPDIRRLHGRFFLGRTGEEISLVCQAEEVPETATAVERDWRAFRVEGVLDFSLVGILAAISGVLAENGISIFAVSTYDTDYILVRSADFERACGALRKAGYPVT